MARTIVMIHGMWSGGWCWENYRQFFTQRGYRCLVPTLRFHDADLQAPPPPELGTTSLLDYAADLEKEISQLEETPILMGHSMGGLLAQILGSRGRASALALLAPVSPHGILALRPSVIRSFWSGLTRWGFWRRPLRQTFAEAAYSTMHLLDPEAQREIYSRYVCESGRAACEIGFWPLDRRSASKIDAARVTCPVLIATGAQDRIVPVSVVRKVAQKYRAVTTYREYANHAHWLLLEPGWQNIAGDIADWLRQQLEGDKDGTE
jgi:pimeloyl-ACP methyl ester carboxylesterase